jgi:hypothetical protein
VPIKCQIMLSLETNKIGRVYVAVLNTLDNCHTMVSIILCIILYYIMI